MANQRACQYRQKPEPKILIKRVCQSKNKNSLVNIAVVASSVFVVFVFLCVFIYYYRLNSVFRFGKIKFGLFNGQVAFSYDAQLVISLEPPLDFIHQEILDTNFTVNSIYNKETTIRKARVRLLKNVQST